MKRPLEYVIIFMLPPDYSVRAISYVKDRYTTSGIRSIVFEPSVCLRITFLRMLFTEDASHTSGVNLRHLS